MYTLCGCSYSYWHFNCHLENKYIGQGILKNGLIIMRKILIL